MKTVSSGRVRLVPNRNCLGLAALLLAMGYAGASQTNAAAYLLGFTLASFAAISMAHAWANLRGLQFAVEPIRPVFAGENLSVRIAVSCDSARARFGLRIVPRAGGSGTSLARLGARERCSLELEIPAAQRGRFETLPVEIRSLYPLGFISASCRVELPAAHFVYPRPEGAAPLPQIDLAARDSGSGPQIEGEDFAGMRAYRTGESQRHIDWKAVARGQPLLIRQWTGDARESLVLDFSTTPGGDVEARLSQLTRWVVQAERDGLVYGLRLPGEETPSASGDRQFHGCLRTLAIFAEDAT